MLRFLYWAVVKATEEKVNFIDENLFEIGEDIEFKGQKVTILDLAVEENISCEEIKMSMEDMMYV
jgi:hypothetical protein